MNEEHPKLLEKEKSTILKYFPSYRPVWDRIVGNVPVKVKNDELYTYYAYVCMRDFADRYQTSGQYFFRALQEFTIQRRLRLNKESRQASVFYFRRDFDYAILCLFSALNHLLSSYLYFYGKKNEVEDRTRTIKEILDQRKSEQFPFELQNFAERYSKEYKYQVLENYRHDWTHRGTPKIEGEYRPKRNNPLETHGFSKNILGLVQHNGGYAMVAWSDEADYSIHKLVSCASWLYRKMGEEAILHFEQVEKTLNYNLSIQDFFGRKDRPE
jgi:hypothetical protein